MEGWQTGDERQASATGDERSAVGFLLYTEHASVVGRLGLTYGPSRVGKAVDGGGEEKNDRKMVGPLIADLHGGEEHALLREVGEYIEQDYSLWAVR